MTSSDLARSSFVRVQSTSDLAADIEEEMLREQFRHFLVAGRQALEQR